MSNSTEQLTSPVIEYCFEVVDFYIHTYIHTNTHTHTHTDLLAPDVWRVAKLVFWNSYLKCYEMAESISILSASMIIRDASQTSPISIYCCCCCLIILSLVDITVLCVLELTNQPFIGIIYGNRSHCRWYKKQFTKLLTNTSGTFDVQHHQNTAVRLLTVEHLYMHLQLVRVLLMRIQRWSFASVDRVLIRSSVDFIQKAANEMVHFCRFCKNYKHHETLSLHVFIRCKSQARTNAHTHTRKHIRTHTHPRTRTHTHTRTLNITGEGWSNNEKQNKNN